MTSLPRRAMYTFAFLALVSPCAALFAAHTCAQTPPAGPRWTNTGATTYQHSTITRLHNGKVIAVSGRDILESEGNKAEIYDPLTGRWRDTKPMNFARYEHTAVLLPDGRLLVLGGWKFQGPGVPPAVAGPPEIFDPATETWSVTTFTGDPKGYLYSLFPAKPMATLLPDGRVLLVGTVGDTSLIFNLSKNAIEYA